MRPGVEGDEKEKPKVTKKETRCRDVVNKRDTPGVLAMCRHWPRTFVSNRQRGSCLTGGTMRRCAHPSVTRGPAPGPEVFRLHT